MSKTAPVVKEHAPEHSQSMRLATSSTVPSRFMGLYRDKPLDHHLWAQVKDEIGFDRAGRDAVHSYVGVCELSTQRLGEGNNSCARCRIDRHIRQSVLSGERTHIDDPASLRFEHKRDHMGTDLHHPNKVGAHDRMEVR